MKKPNQKPQLKNHAGSLTTLTLLFFIIAGLLAAGGYHAYQREATAIRTEKYNDLQAIGDLKINQISNWRSERIGDARLNSASPILRDAVNRFRNRSQDAELIGNMLSSLKLLRDIYHYDNVILTDPDGGVLFSCTQRLTRLEPETLELITQAVSTCDVVFGDFFRCHECGHIHLDVAAPMIDDENRPLAVLILRIDPEMFLYPLIQSWPLPSRTGETLLVGRDGDDVVFLSTLRHRPDPALTIRVPLSRVDLPAARAALGETGLFEGRDYRGVRVLSYIHQVPDSPWFMVAKVDRDEIFADLHERAIIIGLLTLALAGLSGAGVAFIYKHQGKRAFEALYVSEKKRADAKEEFKTTLYSIGDAVITTDVAGCIRQMNPVAEQLTGWNEEEAKGKPIEEVFKIINEDTHEKVDNPVQKVLEKGLVVGLANHTVLISKSGGEIPIADSGAPIRNEAGDVIGVVLVFRNQSQEREREKLILTRLKLMEYATTHPLDDLLQKTLDEVGAFVNSPIGFYHFIDADQKNLTLQAWSTRTVKEFCKAEGKGMHYPIVQAGVWVDCVREKKPVIHNDYATLPNKKGMPEGHAPVIRELVAPIIRSGRIVAILGVGNKPSDYTEKDVEIVSYLADVAWESAERKRLDDALQMERINLQSIMAASPVGLMVIDEKEDIVYVNASAENAFKCKLMDMQNKRCGDFIGCVNRHENDRGCGYSSNCSACVLLAAVREVLGSGTGIHDREMELVKESENGNGRFWYQFSAAAIMLNGKRHAVVSMNDCTERKQSEDKLRESEQRFRLFYENSPVAYQSLDIRGNILEVNNTWLAELGYNRGDVIGKWLGDFLPEDGRDRFIQRFEHLKALGEAHGVEFEMRRKDGNHIHVSFEARVGKDMSGAFFRTHCVFVNVTERKQKEEILRNLTFRQEALLAAIPDIIMEVDANKVYQWANQAGLEFFGEDVIRKEAAYYFEGEQDTYDKVQPLFNGKEDVIYVESWQRRKDGKKRLLAWWCKVLKDENGNPKGGLSSAKDITDQRLLEDQLMQSQKMESVGRLAGGVAHDFNNMLGVIIGHTEMALEQVDSSASLHADLLEIQKAAHRSADLTRQLLAFARRQTVSPVALDLNDTISGMLKMLRRLIGEDLDLVWKPGPEIWTVKIDPVQIDQILANLLVNAKDAISGVGDVTIETANVVLDETYCEAHTGFIPGRFVMMAVSDSGAGMDKNIFEHIFEPFYTTKEVGKGTGLGLATVYGIVKQNNGFINVYSEPGQGSSFKIYLPEAEKSMEMPKEDAPPKQLYGSETVLLVEDEGAILKLGKSILHRYGYTVLAAQSPYEAIAVAKSHQGPIHLLITDVVMPEMNGRELKELLVRPYPAIKCLYMSGYTANAIAHHGVLDEGVNFLQKPFSVKTLAERVRDVLDGK